MSALFYVCVTMLCLSVALLAIAVTISVIVDMVREHRRTHDHPENAH